MTGREYRHSVADVRKWSYADAKQLSDRYQEEGRADWNHPLMQWKCLRISLPQLRLRWDQEKDNAAYFEAVICCSQAQLPLAGWVVVASKALLQRERNKSAVGRPEKPSRRIYYRWVMNRLLRRLDAGQQQKDNAQQAGAFSETADETGIPESTVEKQYRKLKTTRPHTYQLRGDGWFWYKPTGKGDASFSPFCRESELEVVWRMGRKTPSDFPEAPSGPENPQCEVIVEMSVK